jgi:predicted phosphodiesterase
MANKDERNPMMKTYNRIAVFGGVYNNHLALRQTLAHARDAQAEDVFCLGDLGGFGPNPNNVLPILQAANVKVLQGNYDDSIGNDKADCQCGYTHPDDNRFAQISYDYTLRNTSSEFKQYQRSLPKEIRFRLGRFNVLCSHGSQRQTNEFLWHSTSPVHFLEKLCDDYHADVILVTHSGIKWHRALPSGRHVVNVGVIGRPENDGKPNVWSSVLTAEDEFKVDFVPIHYDYESLAKEMEQEKLPTEFVETIRTGYWTTCLEILPPKERAMGIY